MAPTSRQLIDYFGRSLTSFTSSPDPFRVLCTLPHQYASSSQAQPRPSPPSQDDRDHRQNAQRQRLVILDSSFNPPTTAHAQMIQQSPAHDRILLLLSVENADKPAKPAAFPQRLAMMEAFGRALHTSGAGATGAAATVDIGVSKWPYFHDKAQAIAESGFYGDVDMTFLAGYDTLIRIFNPKYYGNGDGREMKVALDGLFGRARLKVTMRPDGEWGGETEQREYLRELAAGKNLEGVGVNDIKGWTERVELVEGVGGSVSSSKAREIVSKVGVDGLGGLVSDEISALIESEGLYQE